MGNVQSNNQYSNNGDVNQNIDKSKTIIKGKGSGNKVVIRITILLAVVFILFCVINIFLKSLDKKIIGTWQVNEQPQIFITFGENGDFSMSGDGDYLDGNYTFLNENTVQVHMKYLWADFVLSGQISINGKKMKIENISDPDDIFGADGVTLTLIRTKR